VGRTIRLLPWLWPVVLTVMICAPLLAPGFVIGYDLVFVPDLTLRLDLFGLTTALPRAIPSDVIVAVLDEFTGGSVLNKAVLLAVPLLGGWGITALWRELRAGGPLAGCAAATVYVWNPFVAERFHLGAWALLLGYAALPWLVRSALKLRHGVGWAGFVLASAACALTASGGATGLLVAAVVLLWPDAGTTWRARVLPLVGAVLLNGPWLAAGLVRGSAATSDPAAIVAFAARDEGYGGVLPTLLTLGGVWNAAVVPPGRGEGVALVLGLIMLLAVGAGIVMWWRRDRNTAAPLAVAGLLALAIALGGVLAPDAYGQLVTAVPGAGLFRDGHRYLGPLALLEAVGFGFAAQALVSIVRRKWLAAVIGATVVLVPVAALPGLADGDGLAESYYPADWEQARTVLAADPRPGEFIPWPFESYRAPAWNGRQRVLDPMSRYFSRPSVVPDELIVAGKRLAGEDPRARAIATALRAAADPAIAADPTTVLLRQGVGWVVVDREAGGPDPNQLLPGLTEVFSGPSVAIYRLNGLPTSQEDRRGAVMTVMAAWVIATALVVAAFLSLVVRRRKQS
jgi:hypothetical protein